MMTLALDGVPLDDPNDRWAVTDETDYLPGIAASVTEMSIPGIDGSLLVDETLTAPTKNIAMLVTGRDDADLKRNVSALLALFRSGRMLSRSIDAVSQTISCQFKGSQAPRYWPDGSATLSVTLHLPGVFWRGDTATWRLSAPTSGVAHPVSTLDGSTAPIDDALILIGGPVVNPKVSCGASWFRLGLTLAAGESALVDCRAWSVRAGAGVTFVGGGTVKTGVLTTSGGPYLLRLRPSMVGTDPTVTQVQVSLTADSGTPSLAVSAAPSFLV